jgi:hypothetical protein
MFKRIYAILITLLLFTLIAVPAKADGVVNSDGYIYSEGYWLAPSSGTLYSRASYTAWDWVAGTPGYYYTTNCCRYWYPGTAGYWQGRTAYSYTPVQVNVNAPDVETQLIALAKARDAGVLRIAAAAQKSASAYALADKLGLSGNFNIPGYGAGIFPIPQYGASLVTSTAVATGNTAYGYQTLSFEAKGVDMNALLQMYGQAVQDSQLYGDNANARLTGVVNNLSELTQRQRQVLANASAISQAAQGVGKAVSPGTDIKVTQKTVVPTKPAEQLTVPPNVANQGAAFLALSGPSQCIKCHGDKGAAQAKFDITLYNPQTASDADVDRVFAYLISADPKASCGNASGRSKLGTKEFMQFGKK